MVCIKLLSCFVISVVTGYCFGKSVILIDSTTTNFINFQLDDNNGHMTWHFAMMNRNTYLSFCPSSKEIHLPEEKLVYTPYIQNTHALYLNLEIVYSMKKCKIKTNCEETFQIWFSERRILRHTNIPIEKNWFSPIETIKAEKTNDEVNFEELSVTTKTIKVHPYSLVSFAIGAKDSCLSIWSFKVFQTVCPEVIAKNVYLFLETQAGYVAEGRCLLSGPEAWAVCEQDGTWDFSIVQDDKCT